MTAHQEAGTATPSDALLELLQPHHNELDAAQDRPVSFDRLKELFGRHYNELGKLTNTLSRALTAAREALEAKEWEVRQWKDEAADMRRFHEACIRELYSMLGVDGSDGEIRFKWAALAVSQLKRDKDAAEAALAAYKDAAPLCDKHQPTGGTRSTCLVCALESDSAAFSRISYACEPPNEMECSAYDVHCDPEAVVEQVKAALAGVREESKWIRRKLSLPEDCGFVTGDTTLAGAMHNVCHNSHGYLAYVYTYKCDDKQGIIANLTRALLPFAEPPETNKHSGPAEDYDRARDILAKIPTAPPSSGSPAEGA